MTITVNLDKTSIAIFGNYNQNVINSDEIIAKIILGKPTEYDNAIIVGDILIENQKIIYPLNITNSDIKGNVTFYNITFINGFNFVNDTFHNFVLFRNTTSMKNSTIRNSTFIGYAAYSNSALRFYNPDNSNVGIYRSIDFGVENDFRSELEPVRDKHISNIIYIYILIFLTVFMISGPISYRLRKIIYNYRRK